MIVLKFEFTAVQLRHRRRETQAQAGTRLGAALLKADKALDHTSAIGRSDSGAVART